MARYKKTENDNGLIGYYDEISGNTIEAKFEGGPSDFGTDTYGGKPYATIQQHSKFGVIDEYGNLVVPAEYEDAYHLCDDLFAVRKSYGTEDWRLGIINLKGEVIIPFEYRAILKEGPFIQCATNATAQKNTLLWRFSTHRYEYLHLSGLKWLNNQLEVIYEGEIKEIKDFRNNALIIIKEGLKLGAINSSGKTIIPAKYTELYCPCENRFIAGIQDHEIRFGVINEKEKAIIPFEYKQIDSENGSFYCCYTERGSVDAIWMNRSGSEIFQGKATPLSDTFLKIEKNGKQGVINQEGKRIINYIYDDIICIEDKLVVSRDEKVGILGGSGELIIAPSYSRIECIHLSDFKHISAGHTEVGQYYPEYPFDSSAGGSPLFKREIYYTSGYYSSGFIRRGKFLFENDTVFILETDEYSELFTLEEGLLQDSKSEKIAALTNISFAVKRNGKWGVYRADIKQILIPCTYDRITFSGGHTVLLNQGELWGAQTLVLPTHPSYTASYCDTNIPISFYEIKIIDPLETLFSAKYKTKDSFYGKNNEEEFPYYYTLVNRYGEKIESTRYLCSGEHFIYFSDDRILSCNGEKKYGFISLKGYQSIPFKYDIIQYRGNHTFDVCINGTWGILDISGKEQIRYLERIPQNGKKRHIVRDCRTEYYGVLNENGTECIPPIYEHLMFANENRNLIFFGYKGLEESKDRNFFSGKVSGAIWGCINAEEGKVIIDDQYDCFKLQDGFILGGRNGCMLYEDTGRDFYESEYGGIYDLFDLSGKLIIGGFSYFLYDNQRQIYFLLYGGRWQQYPDRYTFIKGNSRWLVLTRDLISIVKKSDGERATFQDGFIGTITEKTEGEVVTNYWNMPLELFSINLPVIKDNLMISGDDTTQYAVRLEDGVSSMGHKKISILSNDMYFFWDIAKNKPTVGLAHFIPREGENYVEEVILDPTKEHLSLLTNPIEGYAFGVQEYEDGLCKVILYDINHLEQAPLIAIESIGTKELKEHILADLLLLSIDENAEGLKRIILSDHKVFEEVFLNLISPLTPYLSSKENYWFAPDDYLNGISIEDDDQLESLQYNNRYDYIEDNWDAMTDGMYGDMPDGFSGDFDFLG